MSPLLLITVFSLGIGVEVLSLPRGSPYSLQAAVDTLHRQEAQLALGNGGEPDQGDDDSYWMEDELNYYRPNRQRFNKLLAAYLRRDDDIDPENDSYDPSEFQARKRSFFRERDEKSHPTVFREREMEKSNRRDLSNDFLSEMDKQSKLEEEERYLERLRHLWELYQQQENDIAQELFENDEDTNEMEDKKRMIPQLMNMNNFESMEKRQMPMLPWLPATKKKRFPIAKRSPKPEMNFSETDEKVAKDLQALFGTTGDDSKKKRSSDEIEKRSNTNIHEENDKHKMKQKRDSHDPEEEEEEEHDEEHEDDSEHDHYHDDEEDEEDEEGEDKRKKKRSIKKKSVDEKTDENDDKKKRSMKKRDNTDDSDDEDKKRKKKSVEEEQDEEDKKKRSINKREDNEEEESDDEDTKRKKKSVEEEQDEEDKKKRSMKKREDNEEEESNDDVKKKKRTLKKRQNDESNEEEDEKENDKEHDEDDEEEEDKKKKKKRSSLEILKEDQILPGDIGDLKQKKSIQWNKYFGLDRKKKDGREYPLNFNKNFEEERRINDLNEEKLDTMDEKLKTIENMILSQTVKYSGDHEGNIDPEDLQQMKDKVVSQIATAYSLEKMRNTLGKLKDTFEENERIQNDEEMKKREAAKKKRVAVKKEKAEFDNNDHVMEGHEKVLPPEVVDNDFEESDDEKKKKKKRLVKRLREIFGDEKDEDEEEEGDKKKKRSLKRKRTVKRFQDDNLEENQDYQQLNEAIEDSTECPLLDTLEKRCRGVDILSGDIYQELLPACGAHQLCYLCGTSSAMCDLQYLTESEAICESNPNCQTVSRSALMMLQGFPAARLGPKECAKNPCLYRAMIEMGVTGF